MRARYNVAFAKNSQKIFTFAIFAMFNVFVQQLNCKIVIIFFFYYEPNIEIVILCRVFNIILDRIN